MNDRDWNAELSAELDRIETTYPSRPTPQPSTPNPTDERCQCGHTRFEHESRYNAPNHCTHRCAPPWTGRADSPSPEGEEPRPSWVPFDAHPDYVYAAQQVYRWEPLDGDCRRHHGPHKPFRCNGALGRLIESHPFDEVGVAGLTEEGS